MSDVDCIKSIFAKRFANKEGDMVTTLQTRERIEVRPITLEELGEMVGIPIKVRPWWGSARRRAYTVEGVRYPSTWICPGGVNGTQIKRPEIQGNAIILWQGPCHWHHQRCSSHSQIVTVKSVGLKAMLITLRVWSNYAQYLIGVDGNAPYVVPVKRSLSTVKEAFDWLMPNMVRDAIARGLDVKRQGDWFFIPTDKMPKRHSFGNNVSGSRPSLKTNTLYRGVALIYHYTQTRHRGGLVIYQSVAGTPNDLAPFVRGKVTSPDHPTLQLKGWHIGVRNRSTPWRNVSQRRGQFDD